jgi:hypothetical protein
MSQHFINVKGIDYSNEEMQILDFMADESQSFRTYVRHQVAGFYVKGNFYLVVYIHNKFEEARFHRFTVPDYKNNREALYRLIYALEAEVQEMKYPTLYRMAKDKVVHVIHSMTKPIR